jgi:hypothetical protein
MAYWIALGRSVLAMILGLALIFYPKKAQSLFVNFIGLFWIAGSLMTIRWGLANERSRLLTILVGVVGIVAGMAALASDIIDNWILLDRLLGATALLTGILHVSSMLQVRPRAHSPEKRSGVLLGTFEIGLGLVLLLRPYDQRLFVHYVAAAWAFVGGITIFLDALVLRRKALEPQDPAPEPPAG